MDILPPYSLPTCRWRQYVAPNVGNHMLDDVVYYDSFLGCSYAVYSGRQVPMFWMYLLSPDFYRWRLCVPSETLVTAYQVTRRHNPEGHDMKLNAAGTEQCMGCNKEVAV
jgi:hypothetical protein